MRIHEHRAGKRPGMPKRGIALIEALVALTVTALGVVAVLGIQSVLRQNADLAKQRAEAVRLAQEEIERWRSFDPTPAAGSSGTLAYSGLATGSNLPVAGSNTVFTVSRVVTDSAAPVYRALSVRVDWNDRNGQDQRVVLNTNIGNIPPELGATAAIPAEGKPVARAGGRHGGIPPGAKRLSATQSGFRPPQDTSLAVAVVWIFDHVTGVIQVCNSSATSSADITLAGLSNCDTTRHQLLAGFLRFALPMQADNLTPRAPTAADAEQPVWLPLLPPDALSVMVRRTAPTPLLDVGCFTDLRSTFVAYFCAVPVSPLATAQPIWSGRAMVTGSAVLTDDPLLVDANRVRVCRYTRYDDDRTVASGSIRNEEHPLDYLDVDGPLLNQNFLIIRAGDGTQPFGCPQDDPLTPLNTTTRAHPLP